MIVYLCMRVLVYKGRAVRCWPLAVGGDEGMKELKVEG